MEDEYNVDSDLDAESEAYFAKSLMPQVLPVCADVDDNKEECDFSKPPASAFEYLQQVRAESSKYPDTCTVKYKEMPDKRHRAHKQLHQYKRVDYSKSSAALLKMFSERDEKYKTPNKYFLSEEERDYIISMFQTSRDNVEQYKLSNSTKPTHVPLKFPRLSDCEGWLTFCLSSDGLTQLRQEGVDHTAVMASDENDDGGDDNDEDIDVGDDNDNGDDNNDSDDDEDTNNSPAQTSADKSAAAAAHSLPLLSVISQLSQEAVNCVIEHLATLVRAGHFNSRLGNWLFALLTCLPIPLPSTQVATLRQLIRYCRQIRSHLGPSQAEAYLSGLNILITVVAYSFGQKRSH